MTYSVQSPPFVTGTAIVAADHNANWTGVETYINAIITGANMDANSIGTTQLQATSVTTAKIATGAVTNNEINAAAAIALSKLATGALPVGITVASANIVDGTIVDADISGTAAIALSKLATGALPTAITVASANIVSDTIVNVDINSAAAIDASKLDGVQLSQSGNNNSTTFSTSSPAGGTDGDIWFKYV
jgi:hypothetical protein